MSSVLLVAPSCDGTDVGEAWIAYQWAAGLAARHDVVLLTYRQHGRPSAVPQLPEVEVVEWEQPAVFSVSQRFNSLLKPWYPLFHGRCVQWLADATARGRRFDVAHQPVPVALRYPSPLARFDIPYVVGPVGGSLSSPPGFAEEDTAPWYVGLRAVDGWRLRHDPLLRRSYERAAVVLGIAPYVADSLAPMRLRDLRFMSDTAVVALPAEQERPLRQGPVRLLFVGRVIRTKGVRDAVRAMALLRDLDVVLDIVGDGFDRSTCEKASRQLGLTDRIVFHGARSHEEVDGFYRRADVFVFPSFREPGGIVVGEAMSHGLPVVVCDRGGPAAMADGQTGVRVELGTPDDYPRALATALRGLVIDPDLRRSMGAAARRKIEQRETWQAHLDRMDEIYADVTGS